MDSNDLRFIFIKDGYNIPHQGQRTEGIYTNKKYFRFFYHAKIKNSK